MIDYIELQRALEDMRPRQKLYELIKREMQRRGRWKKRDRGAPPPVTGIPGASNESSA